MSFEQLRRRHVPGWEYNRDALQDRIPLRLGVHVRDLGEGRAVAELSVYASGPLDSRGQRRYRRDHLPLQELANESEVEAFIQGWQDPQHRAALLAEAIPRFMHELVERAAGLLQADNAHAQALDIQAILHDLGATLANAMADVDPVALNEAFEVEVERGIRHIASALLERFRMARPHGTPLRRRGDPDPPMIDLDRLDQVRRHSFVEVARTVADELLIDWTEPGTGLVLPWRRRAFYAALEAVADGYASTFFRSPALTFFAGDEQRWLREQLTKRARYLEEAQSARRAGKPDWWEGVHVEADEILARIKAITRPAAEEEVRKRRAPGVVRLAPSP